MRRVQEIKRRFTEGKKVNEKEAKKQGKCKDR
jgi:hypothetical protein